MRRTLRSLAVTTMTASVVIVPFSSTAVPSDAFSDRGAPVPAARADSWGPSCDPEGYGTKRSVVNVRTAPTFTHLATSRPRKDVQIVSYAGVSRDEGTFGEKTCAFDYVPGTSYGYYRVRIRTGLWRSQGVPGEGEVQCGAGTSGLGALATAALRLGCRG